MRDAFHRFAVAASRAMGSPWSFSLAVLTIIVWALFGPSTNYSSEWQLWINSGTTVVTFLMVFLIQETQNRDNKALNLKLDELIRASEARNSFIEIEEAPEQKLLELKQKPPDA